VPEEVIGEFRPGTPSNDHARGFELALEAALNKASERAEQEPTIAQLLPLDEPREVTIFYKANVTRHNPVDIDGYIAIIQLP
jgi:hypothetical protein